MQNSLIPEELLKKSDKILFLTHLAIGDFTYMQNYFKELSLLYPNLKIDLWVDEQRGKNIWQRLISKKSNYILYDWLQSCSFLNKVYGAPQTKVYDTFKNFLLDAKNQNYPIVVFLSIIRQANFAKYARAISPKGFIAGTYNFDLKKYQLIKKSSFKKIDKLFNPSELIKTQANAHISDIYANWFENIFALKVEKEKRYPFIDLPKEWRIYAKLKFLKWGITENNRQQQKVIFINSFAKNDKRCWPMENVIQLIANLRKENVFYNASFIVNVIPDQYKKFEKLLKNLSLQKIFLFTATYNYFQLPAIISICDLVISVETSTIHLAPALNVPVVALMRQKNPEWAPFGINNKIVYTKNKHDCVKDIRVDEVVNCVKSFLF